jgi:hypothetical protein
VGYGACLYVRSKDECGNTVVSLICAKSRVAPLKTITITRLELCGALLLARLYRETYDALNIKPSKVIFWCDSTIVLHWLKTPPHLLKTYVSNRVVEVQEITSPKTWRHVGSEDNPADALSRGQLPHIFLQNRIWSKGLLWLDKDEDEWPDQITQSIEIPELKRNTCLMTTFVELEIFRKCSSYLKLKRIIAYCLRWRSGNKYTGALGAAELKIGGRNTNIKNYSAQFYNEVERLKEGKNLASKSRIANLNPFVDENGLIRVGGRL